MQSYDRDDKPIGEPVQVADNTEDLMKQIQELENQEGAEKIKVLIKKEDLIGLSPTQKLIMEWKIKKQKK